MSLLNYYNDNNLVTSAGKTQRITCSAPTDPIITFNGDLSAGGGKVEIGQWFEMTCHSTAAFSYVGMDYNTAKECRDDMIEKFTRQTEVWEYKETLSGSTYIVGWQPMQQKATVQEAEVQMSPMGGHMWQVGVQVDCCDVKYTTSPSSVSFDYPACMSDVK